MSVLPSEHPTRLPRQIPFIIGNEICERFSFYGMRVNLMTFLAMSLYLGAFDTQGERDAQAKATFHLFMSGVYFFPLLGGILADRLLGRYLTIVSLSVVYCAGHALLAIFEGHTTGFLSGLFLIALGSGGIKPCVSAMVGDQFAPSAKKLAGKVFAAFYWSVNLGSFFASLLMPLTLKHYGPGVAFGIPGVLMGVATVIFVLGSGHYVKVPRAPADPNGLLRVLLSAWRHRAPGSPWLGAHLEAFHPRASIDAVRAVFRLLSVFAVVPFFWMLFDQKASTWVVQAGKMDRVVLGVTIEAAQMQVVNPALILVLIPLMTGAVYPWLERLGLALPPLRKMAFGMVFGALSYAVAGVIDLAVTSGNSVSILYQFGPYVLLTLAEVLVSVTGLEYAYSQAPPSMKSTIMSLWNVNVTLANLAVALLSYVNVFSGSMLFFFYGFAAFLAGLILLLLSRRQPALPS